MPRFQAALPAIPRGWGRFANGFLPRSAVGRRRRARNDGRSSRGRRERRLRRTVQLHSACGWHTGCWPPLAGQEESAMNSAVVLVLAIIVVAVVAFAVWWSSRRRR